MKNDKEKIKDKVSVITPTYNSALYVADTIQSVINQTYTNWEMIIVDDHSNDKTVKKIREIEDPRIKVIVLEKNSGAAIARNTALQEADGEYFAFLDSDDLWKKDKLAKQISFMKDNHYDFTSTAYEHVSEDGEKLGVVVPASKKLDYNGILKYCPGNSTVIYNAKNLGVFFIPDIKRRNDFVMWLQVIKKSHYHYGLPEVLTYYQVREGSLSSKKTDLVKYQWKVYREIEKLPLWKSSYLLLHKTVSILLK